MKFSETAFLDELRKIAFKVPRFVDPASKATGIKRVGEKLLGTRAKRLESAIGGLDHDIRNAKSVVDHAAKQHTKARTPASQASVSSAMQELEGLQSRRRKLHTELHGQKTLKPARGGGNVQHFTPGERHAVKATRDTAKNVALVGGTVGLYTRLAGGARGEKKKRT